MTRAWTRHASQRDPSSPQDCKTVCVWLTCADSTFTVRSVNWVATPRLTDYEMSYHTIEVDVAPDNAKEPMTLPLAPWA